MRGSPLALPRPRPVRLALVAALSLVLAGGLAGCGSVAPSKHLSFATAQALNPGVDGRWILEEFPSGAAERTADGRLRRLSYSVDDPRGKSHRLTLDFDEHEILVKKNYDGPLLRPVVVDPNGPQGPTPVAR